MRLSRAVAWFAVVCLSFVSGLAADESRAVEALRAFEELAPRLDAARGELARVRRAGADGFAAAAPRPLEVLSSLAVEP